MKSLIAKTETYNNPHKHGIKNHSIMICERGFGLVRIPFLFFGIWSKKNSLTVANLDVNVVSRQM